MADADPFRVKAELDLGGLARLRPGINLLERGDSRGPDEAGLPAAAEFTAAAEALPDAYPHRVGTLDIEVVVADTAARVVLPAGAAAGR